MNDMNEAYVEEQILNLANGNPGTIQVLARIYRSYGKFSEHFFELLKRMNLSSGQIHGALKYGCDGDLDLFVHKILHCDKDLIQQLNQHIPEESSVIDYGNLSGVEIEMHQEMLCVNEIRQGNTTIPLVASIGRTWQPSTLEILKNALLAGYAKTLKLLEKANYIAVREGNIEKERQIATLTSLHFLSAQEQFFTRFPDAHEEFSRIFPIHSYTQQEPSHGESNER
ncbi:MAG: hypothetical protein WAZ18_03150 [Alphaproteobacteria bacterium]